MHLLWPSFLSVRWNKYRSRETRVPLWNRLTDYRYMNQDKWNSLWHYSPPNAKGCVITYGLYPQNYVHGSDIILVGILQWHHNYNERYGVSNPRQLHCLFNRMFRRISKKALNLCIIGPLRGNSSVTGGLLHDDVIKWKHWPRYWPFVWGIHRSPVNSPHNGQWRGALMFSSINAWTNVSVNTQDAGDLRRHRVHYDVTVMQKGSVTRKMILCYDVFMELVHFTHIVQGHVLITCQYSNYNTCPTKAYCTNWPTKARYTWWHLQ